jgi:hypothetical protein
LRRVLQVAIRPILIYAMALVLIAFVVSTLVELWVSSRVTGEWTQLIVGVGVSASLLLATLTLYERPRSLQDLRVLMQSRASE